MARGIQLSSIERLALAGMAERRGKRESEVLSDLIRQAVRQELAAEAESEAGRKQLKPGSAPMTGQEQKPAPGEQDAGSGGVR